MNIKPMWSTALSLCALLLVQPRVFAGSFTLQVAREKKPCAARDDWPEGVAELVNDPVRANGWKPCFTELPNDIDHYEMKVRGIDDVQRIIRKLATTKAEVVQIRLDPQKEPGRLAWSTVLPRGNEIGAVFSIGSQTTINQWFQRLPEVEPGVRKFGGHRYRKPLAARPPRLTLYVGNRAVDLGKLDVPLNVKVGAAFPDSYGQKHKDDPTVKAIGEFIAEHKAKQKAARTHDAKKK